MARDTIGGVMDSLRQYVLGVTMHIQLFGRRRPGIDNVIIAPPNVWIMLGIAAALILIGVTAARMTIKPRERRRVT